MQVSALLAAYFNDRRPRSDWLVLNTRQHEAGPVHRGVPGVCSAGVDPQRQPERWNSQAVAVLRYFVTVTSGTARFAGVPAAGTAIGIHRPSSLW
jgi:hypothetical protein